MSDSERDSEHDNDLDLFGDEADQAISDQELASDQDEVEERSHARDHRDLDDNDGADEDQEVKVKRIMGVTIYRHKTPRTTHDGLVCLIWYQQWLQSQI